MKGIVFKELLTMMEKTFGDEMTEEVLDELQLDSEGAYTSVGTYDYGEALSIVTKLAEKTGVEAHILVKKFGQYLLNSFYGLHPEYFANKTAEEFLSSIDSFIHVEVKKLTPDAELPSIKYSSISDSSFELEYSSSRPFADLAEGLIEETFVVLKEDYKVSVDNRNDPCRRKFTMEKN